VSVEVAIRHRGKKVSGSEVKKTAEKILELLGRETSELSLVFVGNREMSALNARYRKKNRPTDVLSFPFGEPQPPGPRILGDVVISLDQAEAQARKRRCTLEEEVKALMIHGILHLLGYDHERSRREARIMRAMEKKVCRALCDPKALKL